MFFKPKGPICQSCGMPLSRDAKGGGTEANGQLSTDYCSHCYIQGAFTEPHITLNEMTEKVKNILSQMYIPRFLGSFFVKDMYKLKRWQKDN